MNLISRTASRIAPRHLPQTLLLLRTGFAPGLLVWALFLALQIVCHLGFLAYNGGKMEATGTSVWVDVIYNGLALRASVAAYLTLLPAMLFALHGVKGRNLWIRAAKAIICFEAALVAMLETADFEAYRSWGVHLHASTLQYLSHPAEALASVGSSPWYVAAGAFLAVIAGFWLATRLWLFPMLDTRLKTRWVPGVPVSLIRLLTVLWLVVPARGGLQQMPISQSSAYFSDLHGLNQAATSPTWTFLQSASEWAQNDYDRYLAMPANDAKQTLAPYFQPDKAFDRAAFVGAKRPDVVFIIWESLTAKAVRSLGGRAGITPNLDSLSKESLFFTNCYATGDRSEKGLLSLLTGFPAQPTVSAVIYPDVTGQFPHLSSTFNKAGYHNAFWYGGEPEFANIRSLLRGGHFDAITGRASFRPDEQNSKWGAHDHVLFNRFLQDRKQTGKASFSVVYTLSSHEPFEVPGKPTPAGASQSSLFLRSLQYSDSCVGDLVARLKADTLRWDSTLVVIVADHGHRLPGHSRAYNPKKFHIPLLVMGGALKAKPARIPTLCSQADVPVMIEALCGLENSRPYSFARNPLAAGYRPRAFFTFDDGAGFFTPGDTAVFDQSSKRMLKPRRRKTALEPVAKAYLQEVTRVMER